MQEPPESADEAHMTRRNGERASWDPAPLHSTFERGQTQADQRPQQPRSPLDAPELDPQWLVEVAGGPELANHPVVIDAVDIGHAAIPRHAQDGLGHALQVP